MLHCKLQIGCLIVLIYLAFIYFRECKEYHISRKKTLFTKMLLIGILCVIFDAATAYTVNHLETVNLMFNKVLHVLFLASLDSVIFILCLYMLIITGAYPEKKFARIIIFVPFIINILFVIANMNSLYYVKGNSTNYSIGISVYTCYAMAALYIFLSIAIFFKRWSYIERHKRTSIFTYLLVLAVVSIVQLVFPETLITSVATTVFILGVYLNLEAPAFQTLSLYHRETVMAFTNLIENRDNSTGGHIKRTSIYVRLIAEELRDKGQYSDILTKDYITNLTNAAPMHDIGKISVPDAILQKPGKLTDEEFNAMKLHTENGGKIIQETFKNLGSEEYRQMAYEVARYHHEKWNGKGYPEGLKAKEIPLCARIMAVADVFDAVSEKRCYREAMPLDKCFEIIKEGRGRDFEPLIVDTFMDIREKVEQVHEVMQNTVDENHMKNSL